MPASSALVLFISALQAQERKDITVTQLLSTTVASSGQPIVLLQKEAQIVVSIYDVMPGATLPVHNHPYSRCGYVLSGNLRVTNMDIGQVDTYKPGDFILESVGQWQMGANIGGEPAQVAGHRYCRERPNEHSAAQVIGVIERGLDGPGGSSTVGAASQKPE